MNNKKELHIVLLIIATFFAILFFIVSCKPQQVFVEKSDTIYKVMPDEATMQALIECDSNNIATLRALDIERGKRLTIEPIIYTDTIEKTLKIKIKGATDTIYQPVTNYRTTTVIKEKEISKYYSFCSWYMWISIAIILLCMAWRLFRKYYLHI